MLLNQIFGENHTPFGNVIEAATRQNPTRITSTNHGLETGDTIIVSHTKGIRNGKVQPWGTAGGSAVFGPGPYVVTVSTDPDDPNRFNEFTVPVDASTFIQYYADEPGDWLCTTSGFEYGWHKLLQFPQPNPPTNSPTGKQSAVYTSVPAGRKQASQLFFANSNGEVQLTDLRNSSVRNITEAGIGLRTPFGYIINFGQVKFDSDGEEYSFPIPYTSSGTIYSLTATPAKQVATGFFSVEVVSRSRFKGYFFSPPIADSAKCYYFAIGT